MCVCVCTNPYAVVVSSLESVYDRAERVVAVCDHVQVVDVELQLPVPEHTDAVRADVAVGFLRRGERHDHTRHLLGQNR